jgi:hypothetical protein
MLTTENNSQNTTYPMHLCSNKTQSQTQTYESLLRLGGDLDRDTELVYLRFLSRAGLPLLLSALTLPFPFAGGLLESLRPRLEGGLGERLGLVEYLRLLGGGLLDTDSDGLRPRRFGGGDRDAESAVRLRRFGGGERETLGE